MVAHAKPRKFALYTETAFVTGGPADWSANGTFAYVIEPDISGAVQAVVENENNVLRPRATHQAIRGLKNGALSFGSYMYAKGATAAEAAAATTYHIADLLQAALGGRDLGWAAGIVSSGAEDADEIELSADPGYAVGDWIYAMDTSSGIGEFYRITAIVAGPPITLTLDRDLHFTPDVGGADTIHAVIDCFIHQAATTQHDHTSHKTMQFLVQGDHADDVWICKGVKPSVSIEPITAGEPTKLSFDCLVTTFDLDDNVAEDFGAAVPVGEAGAVPGIGTTTSFKMADFGDPLAEVSTRGSISVGVGVAYDRIASPNGHEGVAGHVDTLEPTTLEVMVPFTSDYNAEFRAETTKHALIQVGNGTQAWGVYCPKLAYNAEPTRGDEGALTTSNLTFMAMEDSASPGALSGDNLEKFRSPLHILIVA